MTSADELQQDWQIASRLERSWNAFLARFGRLTPIQREVVPLILDGRDVLACSPTASGKTEAAAAPLVERNLGRWQYWTVLYISPTRALVNDLFERLTEPLSQLGLRLVRRTGDHKDALTSIPHFLLTTPESFDSLLCRGRSDEFGHILANVRAVVLDEIHLLAGTARGEHIRWLLRRLRRLRDYAVERKWVSQPGVQLVGLSATVAEPESLLASLTDHGIVKHVSGGRTIETVAVQADAPTVEAALPTYIESLAHPEKILVFSNSRRRVDALSADMSPVLARLGYRTFAHHGSLAKGEREETEEQVKALPKVVVFATSTLEIGIDIGDIDLVVLDGPAPSISAFLQRVGRGNRRTTQTRVMPCAGDLAESLIQAAMIEQARGGNLGPVEGGTQYAVARQQVASFILQSSTRAREEATVKELIEQCDPTIEAGLLLRHLSEAGEFVRENGKIRLGESWLEQSASGKIHSNIEQSLGYTVVDDDSGREIAKGVRYRGGKGMAIAGRLLQIRAWADQKIEVKRVHDQRDAQGSWGYTTGKWITGAGQGQALRAYWGFDSHVWPVLVLDKESYAFHFGGTRRRAVIELLKDSAAASGRTVAVNEWFIRLDGQIVEPPSWLTGVSATSLKLLVPTKLDQLERTLARPSANKHLPTSLRLREVEQWLDLEHEVDSIDRSRWLRVMDQEQSIGLKAVVDRIRR